jgi:type I restriction-modification system DNA methylase subunit
MISQNEIRNRAIIFAKEYENDFSEDAEAKSFWQDFFEVFGVSRRRVASFEYPVKKQSGSDGFIDVLWKGVMLAEHKSRGRSLDKAVTQAKDYFPGLKDAELPRYIIVSDFEKFKVFDLESENKDGIEFLLKDLHKNIHHFGFISGYTTDIYAKEEKASIEAAKLMSDFHNEIEKTGYKGHDLEIFLIRTLFCLFADDTGIFPKNHFKSFIQKRINQDGFDLGPHLQNIFHVLNTPIPKRQTNLDEQLRMFPYVNGGIFAESISPVSLDATAYLRLLKCCDFDWSSISPSIFGSIFQGAMDENRRRELGAHYTSEINILKVINPLFLDELQIEFDEIKYDNKKLTEFHKKLSKLKFLDPACGCGNFLVVAYKELRKLELKIIEAQRKNSGKVDMMVLGTEEISILNINQFYGIEVEDFPSQVAKLAMYLADHQMNILFSEKLGIPYARIPLREPASIVNKSALSFDWNELVSKNDLSYILGNPPFIGARLMTSDQKKELLGVFKNGSKLGNLDFVTCWYEIASNYIQDTNIKVAFVSTNSICQGEQVGILWKRLFDMYGIKINFAHQTFKWSNEAKNNAGVYCVIVGFSNSDNKKKYLFEYETPNSEPREKEVKNINAYLIDADNIFLENRNNPICNVPEIVFGNMPNDGGNLLFSEGEKEDFLRLEPDAKNLFKTFLGAKEYLNGVSKYCLWLKDVDPSVIKKLPLVLERIEKIKNLRLSSTRSETIELAKYPSLFAEIRQPNSDYILIPRVSSENRKYIPLSIFTNDYIIGDTCLAVQNSNLFHLGILQSLQHMIWVNYVCGRLESRYRYSNNLVYNNFPWPEKVSESQKMRVEDRAKKVLEIRNNFPNSSLADLYDPLTMPIDLLKAHEDLDKAVDNCYGKKFKSKEDRIEFLFELYKEYTK